MKNRDIDILIREALGRSEAELFDELGEQSLLEMQTEVFRGKHRMLIVLTMIVSLAAFGGAIWAAFRFFDVESTRELILYTALFFFFMSATMAMKMWYWLELQKNAVTREVKRLELQVAQLAASLRKQSE